MRPHKIYLLTTLVIAALGFAGGDAHAQRGPSAFGDPGSVRASSGDSSKGLVPVTASVNGGVVPIGSTAQVVVRFRNDGVQNIETGMIRLYPSSTVSANVSMNQCDDEPLTPGAECAMALSIKGLQAGAWRVEMLMRHTGRTKLVTATMAGSVEASADGANKLTSDVESIPSSVEFGSLTESQTLVEPVVLRNITSNPVKISDIYIESGGKSGYSFKTECDTLNPGQACIVTLSWAPKLKGPDSGVLIVEHDGPTALASIPLSGEYSPPDVDIAEIFPEAVPGKGLLVSSKEDVNFGGGIESTSTITVSLVNAGDADLTFKDIRIAGQDSGLSFKDGGCEAGQVLEPVEACALTLVWSPTRVGALLDDVQITHDGARGILVLPVTGTAKSAVSKDTGTLKLARTNEVRVVNPQADSDVTQSQKEAAQENTARVSAPAQEKTFAPQVSDPTTLLDGLRITSFSPSRAIITGPGGSRIVFHSEPIVLGGVPWDINIQPNGIEFSYQGETVLLLFDRSLSSVNSSGSQSGG